MWRLEHTPSCRVLWFIFSISKLYAKKAIREKKKRERKDGRGEKVRG